LNARQIGAAKSDVKGCGNLIANSKQVPPLAKVALEAHALSDPKRRDHASFDLLAGLSVAPTGHDGDHSDSSAVLSFEVSDCAFSDQLDISR
jgi:hypothetical protein